MKPAITIELRVEPTTLSAAHLDDVLIGFTVRNIGRDVVDPELNLSELRVNGKPSHDWGMALGNSGHDQKWTALPPGDSVGGKWALARELFPQPGDYQLVLTVAGVSSPSVGVHVTP